MLRALYFGFGSCEFAYRHKELRTKYKEQSTKLKHIGHTDFET